MSMNYAVIGGDLRSVELAKMLTKDKNVVYTYGLGKNFENCSTLKQAIQNAEIIIGPMPFSKDQKHINTPLFGDAKISIQEIISLMNGKTLIAGNIKKGLIQQKNFKIIDLMDQEELTVLNVIATAEGAIQVAMENTEKVLHGSNILIIGFGRIGKILAKKLEGLSCRVTCSARKNEDFAWIKSYGYNIANTNQLGENLEQYDIIFNTVPHLVLDENRLKYVRKDSLLIDLASKPGGIDEQYVKQHKLKMIWALALPGKVAPVTSAEIMKNTIYHILEKYKKGEEENVIGSN